MIAGVAVKVVRWLAVEAIVVVALWLRRAMLVVVMVVEMWLVQNNDRRKIYLKGSQPG